MRFMLADPRLYTGAGGLGKASEAILRKLPIGAGVDQDDLFRLMSESTSE